MKNGMGKFARKAKVTLDLAVMDGSRSSLGVRTRAKTLALQSAPPPPADCDVCYLELRSRRLEKRMQRRNSRGRCGCGSEARIGGEELCIRSVVGGEGLGTEAGDFGGNGLDSGARARSPCKSTQCNQIKPADAINTPTQWTYSSRAANQGIGNVHLKSVPSALELEEFFSMEEQSLQLRFIDKYNFDMVNDLPLLGRYEWVAVSP